MQLKEVTIIWNFIYFAQNQKKITSIVIVCTNHHMISMNKWGKLYDKNSYDLSLGSCTSIGVRRINAYNNVVSLSLSLSCFLSLSLFFLSLILTDSLLFPLYVACTQHKRSQHVFFLCSRLLLKVTYCCFPLTMIGYRLLLCWLFLYYHVQVYLYVF